MVSTRDIPMTVVSLDNPFLLQPMLMLMHVVRRINNITVLKVSRNDSWSWNLVTAKIAELIWKLHKIFGTSMSGK
jgi:hypothetical protein